MIHALITLVWCSLFFFLPKDIFLSAIPIMGLIAGFYVGREVAQAEYRYIEAYCKGKRANMPLFAVFSPKAWTLKGLLDWLLPCIVVAAVIIIRVWIKEF